MNLLQTIQEHSDASGGSCGITMIQLSAKSGIAISSLKPLLLELRKEGKIQVREGINLNLIYPVN